MFWLTGLWLAHQARSASGETRPEPWPSLILLFIATWKLKPIFLLLNRLSAPMPDYWVSLINFDFIPINLVLMAVASRRYFPGLNFLKGLCLFLPAGYLAWLLVRGRFLADSHYHPIVILTLAAALLWKWRPALAWLERLAWVGTISYGIYIFQRPVQWLVRDWLPLPRGSAGSFGLRLALLVSLTLAVAWIGERVLQPRIARWARRRFEITSSQS